MPLEHRTPGASAEATGSATCTSVWFGFVATGRSASSSVVTCNELTWDQLRDFACTHQEGEKDGTWFSAVRLRESRRGKDFVEAVTAFVYDQDTGVPFAEIEDGLVKAGLAAIVSTTHSHDATTTDISIERYRALAAEGRTPSDILTTCKGYRDRVVAGASVVGEIEVGGKPMIRLRHEPCPRHRILVGLSRPIECSSYADHRSFEDDFKRRYAAVAKVIGLAEYDRSCADLARIFFTARHRPGAESMTREVLGRLLDPCDPRVEMECVADAKPPATSVGTSTATVRAERAAGRRIDLRRFCAAFGRHLQLADIIRDHCPEAIFGDRSAKWLAVRCPSDSHDQNGATHVLNASDSEKGSGFTVHCKHATCAQDNDRLRFLGLMLDAGWFTPEVLTDRRYFHGSDEEYAEAMVVQSRPNVSRDLTMPDGYEFSNGKLQHVDWAGGSQPRRTVLCDQFEVLGHSRNEDSVNWATLFRVTDRLGKQHVVTADWSALQSKPSGVREALARVGLRISSAFGASKLFDAFLTDFETKKIVLTVSRPGRHLGDEPVFVCPSGVAFDRHGRRDDVLLEAGKGIQITEPRGSFEAWRTSANAAVRHNHHWGIALFTSVAGTILEAAEMPSRGINFSGQSSLGKSTGQKGAAAVWGSPRPRQGLLQPMRTTANAMEALCALASATSLQCDELAQADQREVGRMIFDFAGEAGRGRLEASGKMRDSVTWRTFLTFSSERSMQDIVTEAGKKWLPGHSVRVADIDVTNGVNTVSREIMDVIEGWDRNYGHAGPIFVQHLLRHDWFDLPEKARRAIKERAEMLVGPAAKELPRRAADTFGVLWLAGDLMVEAGLLDADTDVEASIRWAWDAFRSGADAEALEPAERAINNLRQSIVTRMNVDVIEVAKRDEARREIVAFYDDQWIYVLKDKLSSLSGGADKPEAIRKALNKDGILHRPGKDRWYSDYIPGVGSGIDHYRLDRKRFLGEEPAKQPVNLAAHRKPQFAVSTEVKLPRAA